MTASCEFAHWQPHACGARASWVVAVGTRKSDAQASCGRHLNLTCTTMQAAEQRTGVAFTVTAIPSDRLAGVPL